MKLTETELKQIIKEEISKTLKEAEASQSGLATADVKKFLKELALAYTNTNPAENTQFVQVVKALSDAGHAGQTHTAKVNRAVEILGTVLAAATKTVSAKEESKAESGSEAVSTQESKGLSLNEEQYVTRAGATPGTVHDDNRGQGFDTAEAALNQIIQLKKEKGMEYVLLFPGEIARGGRLPEGKYAIFVIRM